MTRPRTEDGVFVDFETATARDYSLERMSARSYIEDPRFDVLSVAVAVGTGAIRFFHKLASPGGTVSDGIAVIRSALDAGAWLVCHNSGFDALILKLRFGILARRIFDTMGYAANLRLGTSLGNLARHLGLRKLPGPEFDEATLRDPASLAMFARYNATDVRIVRQAFTQACEDPAFPAAEFSALDLTQRNNVAGLRLDLDRVDAVARQLADARDQVLAGIATRWQIDTTKLNSPTFIKPFLESTFGIKPGSLRKDDPELLGAAAADPRLGEFLHARNQVRTLGKYAKLVTAYSTVGPRIFSPLRYNGAQTGRFSGSGRDSDKVNVQNLPKAEKAPHPALGAIRTLLVPEPGKSFVAADLATIEPRVIAALAGEETMTRMFRQRDDIYIWLAGLVFPGVRVKKNGENNHLRKLCKEAVLGLGFGMGLPKFRERVRRAAPAASDGDIKKVYDTYQATFPGIAKLRRDFWSAFRRAADHGESLMLGRCIFSRSTCPDGLPTVEIRLPTGRYLYYRSIITMDVMRPWGPGKDYLFDPEFEYEVRPKRRRGGAKVVKTRDGRLREFVTPQKVVENVVQAVARDIMVHQMLALATSGHLHPVFHVHDELICECEACLCAVGEDSRQHDPSTCAWTRAGQELVAVMSTMPATLPSLADIPVEAELNPSVRVSYAG